MAKLSDILKEKKSSLQQEELSVDSMIESLTRSLEDRQAQKAEIQAGIAQIDSYLTQEAEIDALFETEPNFKLK